MSTDRYTSPLSERYASKEMQYIFSQDMKFTYMEKALDRTGRDRNGAGTFREWQACHHTGTDR